MDRAIRAIPVLVLLCSFIYVLRSDDLDAQGARPYLVKVSRTDPGVVSIFQEREVPVNFKLDGWYIAEADAADLERFEAMGITYQVLDEEAWSEPYYLINRPQREELGLMPDVGEIIHKTEAEALVKISDEQALELAKFEFRLTRIFQKSLPLFNEGRDEVPSGLYKIESDDVIEAIVNEVSVDSLRAYVQRLQDFETRYYATDSIRAAAQWIYDKFVEFGYTDVVFDTLDYRPSDVIVWNVIATKPGILCPDNVFIIGGHYDSIVHDGTDPMVWAPGADDNASGAVAAIEAARILASYDLDYTTKFACWTAEEIGLYGSWDYAEKAYNRGEAIGLYINFDMIGNLDENDPLREVNVGWNPSAQTCADLMVQMANQYTTLEPIPYMTSGGGSDHTPFIQYGYKIVYGSEGDFSHHWHRATDVIDNMGIPYMSEVVKMGLGTLAALSLGYSQPTILFTTCCFEETVGNGNNILDPGETVDLYVRLENTGLRSASEIAALLETDDPDVTIMDDEASFPEITIDAVAENSTDPFTFSLSEDTEPHSIDFTVHVTEGEGDYQTDVTFRLLIGQCTVLLVADDGDIDNQDYYIDTFQYLGVPYDISEMVGMAKSDSRDLLDYSEVIWFTGAVESNTLTPEDQSNLETFLDGGGKLLLSGSMIGYDVGDTPFYKNYLHGRYVSFMTMLHHLNWSLNPVVGEMDITLATEGANAQGFAGETDPISPAVSLFNYDQTTEEGVGIIKSSGSGALAVETSVYKVVYCSFGLEGIEPLVDRAEVLEDMLLWFKEPGIDKGDVDGNGETNIIDALMAVNIVLGLHELTEGELARADMNYDGGINVLDVIQVVNAVLGAGGGAVKRGIELTDM